MRLCGERGFGFPDGFIVDFSYSSEAASVR
jgi:hypothetical protein